MSPNWTRTKIVIEITPLLQACSCLLLVQGGYGFLGTDPEVLIALSQRYDVTVAVKVT